MAKITNTFDRHTSPTGGDTTNKLGLAANDRSVPWVKLRDDELPPLMFQIRFQSGLRSSYSYSNLHEVHTADAGQVELYIYSMKKLIIRLEGRHLRELADLMSNAMVRIIKEADPRDVDVPESDPEIIQISVETIE